MANELGIFYFDAVKLWRRIWLNVIHPLAMASGILNSPHQNGIKSLVYGFKHQKLNKPKNVGPMMGARPLNGN